MQVNDIKVSVIMPVYNSGKYLKTAVESILCQNFREMELILVDDGSTDGSSEWCDEYAKQDLRVLVIHQKNGGICNARNAALKIAKGEYISFCDHDDEFVQGAFENVYRIAKETDADVVKFRKKEFILKKDELIRIKTDLFPSREFSKEDIVQNLFYLKDKGILNCVWDGFFKSNIFRKHYFDESFRSGGEDIAIIYDIVPDINKIILTNNVYYYHYIRRGFSTSTKFNLKNIESKEKLVIRMNETLNRLHINRDLHSFDYVFYLLKFVFFPIISILSDSKCPYLLQEKKEILLKILQADYTPLYLFKQSTLTVFKRSKKIGLGYFLFKHSFYRLLFMIFNIRSKFA